MRGRVEHGVEGGRGRRGCTSGRALMPMRDLVSRLCLLVARGSARERGIGQAVIVITQRTVDPPKPTVVLTSPSPALPPPPRSLRPCPWCLLGPGSSLQSRSRWSR